MPEPAVTNIAPCRAFAGIFKSRNRPEARRPFLRSDNGAVAVIFAVALAPLALSVGVAVNYSRMTALL